MQIPDMNINRRYPPIKEGSFFASPKRFKTGGGSVFESMDQLFLKLAARLMRMKTNWNWLAHSYIECANLGFWPVL